MAKISELDPVPAPDGTEQVPIVKDGVAKKTTLGSLVAAVAQPFVDLAEGYADEAAVSANSWMPSLASLFTRPGFLAAATGRINTSDPSFASTKLLDLNWLEIKQIKLQGHTNVASVAYYDENQNFISGSVAPTVGAYITTIPAVPSNAVYVAFSYKVSDAANQIMRMAFKPAADLSTAQAVADNQTFLTRLFTRQGFHNAGSSTFQADATWRTTPLLDLGYMWIARINLTGNTNVNSIAFYDEAGVFISGIVAGSTGSRVATVPSIPATAFYFTMSYQLSDVANCSVYPISTAAKSPWRSDGKAALDVGSKITNIGYINTSGLVESVVAEWRYSDFIKCNAGEKVGFTLYGHPNIASIAFYDANQQFIAGSALVKPGGGSWSQSATAPAGAAYFRLSSNATIQSALYTTSLSVQLLASGTVATPKFSATPFKRPRAMKLTSASKVVTYGDSRSSTDYAFVATNLATLTGATAEAGGVSGSQTSAQVSNTNMSALFARNADVVIWLPGGNDVGGIGTVGSFDGSVIGEPLCTPTDISLDYASSGGTKFIQALDHGVRKWKAQYYDIRARAGLTGSETEAQKNNLIRALKKPMLILCSDLPQKRWGDPYISNPLNWERKRQAIIEVANRNKIHCVDTMAILGWDMTLEPEWTSPSNLLTNNGIYTMDGLHPNEHGNFAMYQIVCADAGLV